MPANFGQKYLKQRVKYPDLCTPSVGDISEFGRPCRACTEVSGSFLGEEGWAP